jgi:hypothetical protein
LSNKEKQPSVTKLQDQCATMTTDNTITPSMLTTLIPMPVAFEKLGKEFSASPARKKSEDFQPWSKPVQLKRTHARSGARSRPKLILASVLNVP